MGIQVAPKHEREKVTPEDGREGDVAPVLREVNWCKEHELIRIKLSHTEVDLPSPNHSMIIVGQLPNKDPYASPNNRVAIHNVSTEETRIAVAWEMMKRNETMQRQ